MNLLSVNRSLPKPITVGARDDRTGIFKMPVDEPVRVGRLGLEEDVQVAKKHHGGPDQAVYLYSAADYAWFANELGRDLAPGTFGENLTLSDFSVSDFGEEPLYIGDRFEIGEVVLELTAPRIPCATLAARMGDAGFVKRFKKAERPGVYARVLTEGLLRQGDAVVYRRGDSDVTTLELFHNFYDIAPTRAGLERLLSAPIAARSRKELSAQLEALTQTA